MSQPDGELFGARLRELREQRGESQRSLAELNRIEMICDGFLPIRDHVISQMERGLKVPTLTMIIRLAVALECEVADLVDVFAARDLRTLISKRR